MFQQRLKVLHCVLIVAHSPSLLVMAATQSSHLFSVARSIGLCPLESTASTFAPCSNSNSVNRRLLSTAAACSGLYNSISIIITLQVNCAMSRAVIIIILQVNCAMSRYIIVITLQVNCAMLRDIIITTLQVNCAMSRDTCLHCYVLPNSLLGES